MPAQGPLGTAGLLRLAVSHWLVDAHDDSNESMFATVRLPTVEARCCVRNTIRSLAFRLDELERGVTLIDDVVQYGRSENCRSTAGLDWP